MPAVTTRKQATVSVKPKPQVMPAETIDQIAASTLAAVSSEPAAEVPAEATLNAEPIAASKAPIVAVRANTVKDSTKVTMMKTLEPPPTIGDWVGFHELKVSRMSQGSAYLVPRFVADVLLDSKAAVISG